MHTKNQHQTYLLPAAVEEALKLGRSIIPIGKNKKPMIKWKIHQTERASQDQVIEWDQTLKPFAWGMVTGAISGIIALDFDGREGKKRLAELNLNPHIRTGSDGAHVYLMHPGFRVPDAAPVKDGKLELTGLDLRGDGGFVVFCGNSTKGRYEQLRPLEPDPIDTIPEDLRRLCKLVAPPPAASQRPQPSTAPTAAVPATVDPSRLVEKALEVCRSEGRNKGGFWLAVQARDNGFSQAEAEALVLSEYRPRTPSTNTKGQPEPYTEAEARASVNQAFQQPARAGWAKPASSPPRQAKPPAPPEPTPTPAPDAEEAQPEDFELREDGLYFTERRFNNGKLIENTSRISPPIRVVARARTFENSGYSVFVTFQDCQGHERRLLISKKLLYGDGTEALNELIDMGFEPERDKRAINALKLYLCRSNPKNFIRHVSRVGWYGRDFVLPEITITAPGEREAILFNVEEGTAHQYRTSGTLNEWKRNVARLCIGNNRLLFMVSCAFAAPLLGPANLDNIGFHLFSRSSRGKTSSVYVAGSVFGGDPPLNEHGFKDTWHNTANALEAKASLHNDSLLILDEFSQAEPKDVDKAIYFLGNGQGKGRATKTGGAKSTQTFKILILSTGEKTIEDKLAEVGQIQRGGHNVRMIEVPADFEPGAGMFERLHEYTTSRLFAEGIANNARKYYGTPIQRFLQLVVQDYEATLEELKESREQFFSANLPKRSHSETERKLKFFAHVSACGELATRFGVTGWKAGDASEAVRRCWLDSLAHNGAQGPQDLQRGVAAVRQFLHSHGSSRFWRLNTHGPEEEGRIINLAGYVGLEEVDGDTETVYFIRLDAMKNEVLKGLDAEEVTRELNRRGYLLTPESGRSLQFQKRLPVPGTSEKRKMRVYAVLAALLEGDEESEK